MFIGDKHYDVVKREMLLTGQMLSKDSLEFVLIGRKKGEPYKKAKHSGLHRIGLGKSSVRNDFNASLRFANTLREEGISTLIFRDHKETGLLVTTKFLMKGRLRLIYIQDRPLAEMKRDFLHTFRFNQIDAWLTPLNHTATDVKRGTNLDHSKVHVIPIPISRKQFDFSDEERHKAKTQLFPNDSDPKIIGWHVPDEVGFIETTGKVLTELLKVHSDVRLSLNGSAGSIDYLKEKIPDLFVDEHRIVISSYQVYDPQFYMGLDACMVDPELEPFLGVAYRTLLSGILPISRKCLIGNELFDNGKYSVEYGNGSSLSDDDLMTLHLQNGALPNSRKHIGKRLTKKRFKENLEALINALPKKSVAR